MVVLVKDVVGSTFEAHSCHSIPPACRNGLAHPIQLFYPLFSGSNVHRWALNQVKLNPESLRIQSDRILARYRSAAVFVSFWRLNNLGKCRVHPLAPI